MANLRRMFDILRLLVLHPIGSLEDRVHEHVHVLVDRAGDEEPPMSRVVRPKVGSASTERNAQRRSAEDDTHLAETCAFELERKAGSKRVVSEHLDRFERELVQILPERFELRQEIVREGDDVAADLVRLYDVEDLAR
jgi:hypothetical protein